MLRSKFIPMVGAAALLGAGLLASAPVQASLMGKTIAFDLTSDHCTDGCGPAGTVFGTVFLGQNGTTVDVEVDLNSPFAFAKTGSADDQAFKFNATGVVLGDITVNAHIPLLVAAAGSFNGDGTGDFGFGINCPSCGDGLSSGFTTPIDFHVANATIAEVTVPNGNGNVFVADIGNTSTSGTFAGRTGPVDATISRAVPAPIIGHGILILLAVGGVLFGSKLLENLKKHRLHAG